MRSGANARAILGNFESPQLHLGNDLTVTLSLPSSKKYILSKCISEVVRI